MQQYRTLQLKLILSVSIGQGIVGCASITQGTSQVIAFDVTPPHSECIVLGKDGTNLGKVTSHANLLMVPKGRANLTATCRAEFYQSNEISIRSSIQPISMASFLFDFGITDLLTGAMWAYPKKVEVVLSPLTSILVVQPSSP